MNANTPPSSYLENLSKTRKRFVGSLASRLDAIVAQVDAEEHATDRETAPRKLHRLLHDMAGNAAMLELADVETAARDGLAVAERADRETRRLSTDERSELFRAVACARGLADALTRDLANT